MILDTNAVSALLNGDVKLAQALEPGDAHHLPLTVIGEYQFGLHFSRMRKRFEALFRKMESKSVLLAPDRATADFYATLRFELKRKGRPIPENDIWIAALARQHKLKVVSNDAHFDVVENLRRIGW